MTDERLRRIREREYPDPPQGVFLNAASWGLLPRSAAEEVSDLTLSAVQFASGYMGEMGRLGRACRESGVFFFIDAIQALGAVPFDPSAIRCGSGSLRWTEVALFTVGVGLRVDAA